MPAWPARGALLAVGALVAVACSSGGGSHAASTTTATVTTTMRATTTTAVAPPPRGVSGLCASQTSVFVSEFSEWFGKPIPAAAYERTAAFDVMLRVSLNACRSRTEWLAAAGMYAPGHQTQLETVFRTGCAAEESASPSVRAAQLRKPSQTFYGPFPLSLACSQ